MDYSIQKEDGSIREVSWEELNQLKKDILWMFDENGDDLCYAFVPEYSFKLPYWEYVTLKGDGIYTEELQFYRQGVLIVILCMLSEYVNIQGGTRFVFGNTTIQEIMRYVSRFKPTNEKEDGLQELVIAGLTVAAMITEEDFYRNEDFEHPELDKFYGKLRWASENFIRAYYKNKLS